MSESEEEWEEITPEMEPKIEKLLLILAQFERTECISCKKIFLYRPECFQGVPSVCRKNCQKVENRSET
jgi:hypothetical protein